MNCLFYYPAASTGKPQPVGSDTDCELRTMFTLLKGQKRKRVTGYMCLAKPKIFVIEVLPEKVY